MASRFHVSVPRWRMSGAIADARETADDPSRLVTVSAQLGKSGKDVSISYTNCKVVGNGSFGVVFAAKMLGELRLLDRRRR
jgi:glycogen synthase kinase 3 beta